MRRLQPNRSRCLVGIERSRKLVLSMTTRAMQFTRCPCNGRNVGLGRRLHLARLSLRDQADVALSSAAVPRPAGSSLMPLRRAPRRPDLARGVGVRIVKRNQHNQSSACLQPQQSDPIRRRGGIGAWRSEIKEELAALGRCGGHSRSYAPVPLRLAQPSSEVFGLPTHKAVSETGASSATASLG